MQALQMHLMAKWRHTSIGGCSLHPTEMEEGEAGP